MATIFFEIGTVFYSSLYWYEKVIKVAITNSSLIDYYKTLTKR